MAGMTMIGGMYSGHSFCMCTDSNLPDSLGGTMGGMMKPWLHFTQGENLFFMAWVPLSTGAVVGACIGLFMLALIDRWVASIRGVMEAYWTQRYKNMVTVDSPC